MWPRAVGAASSERAAASGGKRVCKRVSVAFARSSARASAVAAALRLERLNARRCRRRNRRRRRQPTACRRLAIGASAATLAALNRRSPFLSNNRECCQASGRFAFRQATQIARSTTRFDAKRCDQSCPKKSAHVRMRVATSSDRGRASRVFFFFVVVCVYSRLPTRETFAQERGARHRRHRSSAAARIHRDDGNTRPCARRREKTRVRSTTLKQKTSVKLKLRALKWRIAAPVSISHSAHDTILMPDILGVVVATAANDSRARSAPCRAASVASCLVCEGRNRDQRGRCARARAACIHAIHRHEQSCKIQRKQNKNNNKNNARFRLCRAPNDEQLAQIEASFQFVDEAIQRHVLQKRRIVACKRSSTL